MLGIRTAPKEELSASSAGLVYGAPLTVPGEFIGAPQDPGCTRSYLQQLRDRVKTLAPVPTQMHGSQSHNVPKDILQSKLCLLEKYLTKIHCRDLMTGHIELFLEAKKRFWST